jgi:hypothetical protein
LAKERDMIHVQCPKCGDYLSVPDSRVGEVEECPNCRNVTVIPEPQSPSTKETTPEDQFAADLKVGRKSSPPRRTPRPEFDVDRRREQITAGWAFIGFFFGGLAGVMLGAAFGGHWFLGGLGGAFLGMFAGMFYGCYAPWRGD